MINPISWLGRRLTEKSEVVRKSIHLSMLVFILLYFRLPKQMMLGVYGIFVILALIVELLRRRRSGFRKWFESKTGPMLRSHEHEHLTGATYLFLASFLTVLLFDRWIAITALFFVVVSDALGGLVGKRWGKHQLWGDRTVEGTIMFFVSALLFVIVNPHIPFFIGLIGVLSALCVEIFVRLIDDNLSVPLCSGFMMQIFVWAIP